MFVGFISIEKVSTRYQWHTSSKAFVYYTPWFDSKTKAEDYIKELITLYPDNNIENKDGKIHTYKIHYIVFKFDEVDFNTLRSMTSALETEWYKLNILDIDN